jgi:predicted nucleic acid-binding protein
LNGYLLDTNIISMLSPSRQHATPEFLAWLDQMDASGKLFLSVVTIHEIEKGIALLELKGAEAKAAELRRWLMGLVAIYEDRILPIDTAAAACGGKLEAKAAASGHQPRIADAAIAGIAKMHDLTIITQNLKHFAPFGIEVRDPNDALKQG